MWSVEVVVWGTEGMFNLLFLHVFTGFTPNYFHKQFHLQWDDHFSYNMLYDVICNMYIRCISSGCFTCWGKKGLIMPHHLQRDIATCVPRSTATLPPNWKSVSHLWLTIQGHIEFFTFPTKTSTWNISWNILGLPPHPGCQSPPGVLHF